MSNREDGLLLTLTALDGAPRRVVLIQASRSPFYESRQGPGYPGRESVWRDFYYAAGYAIVDLVDRCWSSRLVELSQPASDDWPADLAPALLEGIGHRLAEGRLSLQEIRVDQQDGPLADAIGRLEQESQSGQQAMHRALEVESIDRADTELHDVDGIELFRVHLDGRA